MDWRKSLMTTSMAARVASVSVRGSAGRGGGVDAASRRTGAVAAAVVVVVLSGLRPRSARVRADSDLGRGLVAAGPVGAAADSATGGAATTGGTARPRNTPRKYSTATIAIPPI